MVSMELIVAVFVGVLLGAGLVYLSLRGGLQRAEVAAAAAGEELQGLRREHAAASEALARTEAQRDAERQAAAEGIQRRAMRPTCHPRHPHRHPRIAAGRW